MSEHDLAVTDLERAATGPGGHFYGVYPAQVVDNQDPDGLGREGLGDGDETDAGRVPSGRAGRLVEAAAHGGEIGRDGGES